MAFSDNQFRAIAEWWADQLPIMVLATDLKIEHNQFDTPPDRREKFIGALVEVLQQKQKNFRNDDRALDGQACITLRTDYDPQEGLREALQKSGLGSKGFPLPWKTCTYLQEDGVVFVPEANGLNYGVLSYTGCPTVNLVDQKFFDFKDALYFVEEKYRMRVPLEKDQEILTVIGSFSGSSDRNYYLDQAQEEGDFVEVRKPESMPLTDFLKLTSREAFDASLAPSLVFSRIGQAEEWVSENETVEVQKNPLFQRVFSLPFQVLAIPQSCVIGFGMEYTHLAPGDLALNERVSMKSDILHRFRILSAKNFKMRNPIWLPCTPEGVVTSGTPFKPSDMRKASSRLLPDPKPL